MTKKKKKKSVINTIDPWLISSHTLSLYDLHWSAEESTKEKSARNLGLKLDQANTNPMQRPFRDTRIKKRNQISILPANLHYLHLIKLKEICA